MKKLLVLSGLVAVLSFAVVSSSSGAPASSFTVSSVFPIDLAVFVPCANGGVGEDVLLSGNLHDLIHVTVNDNSLHVKTHDQPQGISGTGVVTGDKYQATGVTQDEFNTSFGMEETFINNFRIIGQGPGNNFLVHENFHITINANGTVTASHDNFTVDCK
jgi:hypothetical protein